MKELYRSKMRALLLAASVTAISASASAQSFYSIMNGATEVPANASLATGYSSIIVTGNTLMTVSLNYFGLQGGNPSAAHIHCCAAPGTNVGVAVGFTGFPTTASGSYFGTFNLLDASIYTTPFLNTFGGGTAAGARDALITGMMSGLAYTNIHNTVYPGGEIRGQIAVVPEPATVALTAAGLLAMAGAVRRRRARS